MEVVETVMEDKSEKIEAAETVTDDKVEIIEAAETVTDEKAETIEAVVAVSDDKVETIEAAGTVSDDKVKTVEGVSNGKVETIEAVETVSDDKLETIEGFETVPDVKIETNEKIVSKAVLATDDKVVSFESAITEAFNLVGMTKGKIKSFEGSDKVEASETAVENEILTEGKDQNDIANIKVELIREIVETGFVGEKFVEYERTRVITECVEVIESDVSEEVMTSDRSKESAKQMTFSKDAFVSQVTDTDRTDRETRDTSETTFTIHESKEILHTLKHTEDTERKTLQKVEVATDSVDVSESMSEKSEVRSTVRGVVSEYEKTSSKVLIEEQLEGEIAKTETKDFMEVKEEKAAATETSTCKVKVTTEEINEEEKIKAEFDLKTTEIEMRTKEREGVFTQSTSEKVTVEKVKEGVQVREDDEKLEETERIKSSHEEFQTIAWVEVGNNQDMKPMELESESLAIPVEEKKEGRDSEEGLQISIRMEASEVECAEIETLVDDIQDMSPDAEENMERMLPAYEESMEMPSEELRTEVSVREDNRTQLVIHVVDSVLPIELDVISEETEPTDSKEVSTVSEMEKELDLSSIIKKKEKELERTVLSTSVDDVSDLPKEESRKEKGIEKEADEERESGAEEDKGVAGEEEKFMIEKSKMARGSITESEISHISSGSQRSEHGSSAAESQESGAAESVDESKMSIEEQLDVSDQDDISGQSEGDRSIVDSLKLKLEKKEEPLDSLDSTDSDLRTGTSSMQSRESYVDSYDSLGKVSADIESKDSLSSSRDGEDLVEHSSPEESFQRVVEYSTEESQLTVIKDLTMYESREQVESPEDSLDQSPGVDDSLERSKELLEREVDSLEGSRIESKESLLDSLDKSRGKSRDSMIDSLDLSKIDSTSHDVDSLDKVSKEYRTNVTRSIDDLSKDDRMDASEVSKSLSRDSLDMADGKLQKDLEDEEEVFVETLEGNGMLTGETTIFESGQEVIEARSGAVMEGLRAYKSRTEGGRASYTKISDVVPISKESPRFEVSQDDIVMKDDILEVTVTEAEGIRTESGKIITTRSGKSYVELKSAEGLSLCVCDDVVAEEKIKRYGKKKPTITQVIPGIPLARGKESGGKVAKSKVIKETKIPSPAPKRRVTKITETSAEQSPSRSAIESRARASPISPLFKKPTKKSEKDSTNALKKELGRKFDYISKVSSREYTVPAPETPKKKATTVAKKREVKILEERPKLIKTAKEIEHSKSTYTRVVKKKDKNSEKETKVVKRRETEVRVDEIPRRVLIGKNRIDNKVIELEKRKTPELIQTPTKKIERKIVKKTVKKEETSTPIKKASTKPVTRNYMSTTLSYERRHADGAERVRAESPKVTPDILKSSRHTLLRKRDLGSPASSASSLKSDRRDKKEDTDVSEKEDKSNEKENVKAKLKKSSYTRELKKHPQKGMEEIQLTSYRAAVINKAPESPLKKAIKAKTEAKNLSKPKYERKVLPKKDPDTSVPSQVKSKIAIKKKETKVKVVEQDVETKIAKEEQEKEKLKEEKIEEVVEETTSGVVEGESRAASAPPLDHDTSNAFRVKSILSPPSGDLACVGVKRSSMISSAPSKIERCFSPSSLPSSPHRRPKSANGATILTSEVFTRTFDNTGAIEVIYRQPTASEVLRRVATVSANGKTHPEPTEGEMSLIDTTDSSLSDSVALPSSSSDQDISTDAHKLHLTSPPSPKNKKLRTSDILLDCTSVPEQPETDDTVLSSVKPDPGLAITQTSKIRKLSQTSPTKYSSPEHSHEERLSPILDVRAVTPERVKHKFYYMGMGTTTEFVEKEATEQYGRDTQGEEVAHASHEEVTSTSKEADEGEIDEQLDAALSSSFHPMKKE